MTLRLTDDQTQKLREQAEAEHRSMQSVALTAIDEYVVGRRHKERLHTALDEITEQDAGILKRLGSI